MTARIGINPLTWSNDDMPALGADNSLETCLTQAREAGYAGVELGHKFPRDAATLGPILARHGLALVSGWYSARLLERSAADEFSAMAPHLELLQAMRCEVMVLAEVTGCVHSDMQVRLSRRPHLPAPRWAEFGSRMTELAKLMRAAGMRLAYHHHMGTVVQSGADVDHLMRHTGPEVELLLDTGHLTFAGDDPMRVAEAHAGRIAHVHCKDVRREVLARCLNRDTSFLEAVLQGVFTVPGDGCVDYERLVPKLIASGYRGWWVVEAEQDPAVAEPRRYARMGYECLERLTRSLG
jgi:inosose dehydratase